MFTKRIERTTQIDQSWTVELQRRNGGSARRRQGEHACEVIVPGKMCSPALLARMKQPHECFSDGISNNSALGFMLVAAVAAECQIVSRRRPTETAWYDVINCEGICRVSSLCAAVFATMLAAISNQAAQFRRDVPFRHVRENGWCPSIACTKGRQRDAGRLLIESVDESQMALGNRQGVEQAGGYSPTGPARSRSTSTFWPVLRRQLPSAKARLAMG
jgi:hypothetical protein